MTIRLNSHQSRPAGRSLGIALLTLAAGMLAAIGLSLPAKAQSLPGQPGLQLEFPVVSPGIPAYARLELLIPGFDVPHDKHWAAVVFYRNPDCVPPDFDLGQFFDLPRPGSLGAFACELLVEGHEIWRNGPSKDLGPIYVRTRNATARLPIWFVKWSDLRPLLDSGKVYIWQIRNLPSLVRGEARWFEEALYPNGAASDPGLTMKAAGRLENGGKFLLSWHFQASTNADEVVIRLEHHPVQQPGPPRHVCKTHPKLPPC